jgi:type III secretion system low calcium response chaperone LcrH/SycD
MSEDSIKEFLNQIPSNPEMESLISLPNQVLEENYQKACSLYEERNYDQASCIFKDLLIARPFTKKYWFSFASSMQAKREFEKAAKAWAIAAFLNENDPYPHFYAAECLYSFSDREQTKQALMEAKKRCGNDDLSLKKKISQLEKICNPSKKKIRC